MEVNNSAIASVRSRGNCSEQAEQRVHSERFHCIHLRGGEGKESRCATFLRISQCYRHPELQNQAQEISNSSTLQECLWIWTVSHSFDVSHLQGSIRWLTWGAMCAIVCGYFQHSPRSMIPYSVKNSLLYLNPRTQHFSEISSSTNSRTNCHWQ